MQILGAGLAGCIAGIMNPEAQIIEANESPLQVHKALLRFRSNIVSEITGIKFRKVVAQKSIWYDGKEVQPSPRFTAMYSKKVSGSYSHRSISNINDEVRYIAPADFHEQLLERLEDRILYGSKVETIDDAQLTLGTERNIDSIRRHDRPIISTIPLPIMADMLGYIVNEEDAVHKEIYVTRAIIHNCDMFTTVYTPGDHCSIYRASVTGNMLIIESMEPIYEHEIMYACRGLGLSAGIDIIEPNTRQEFGKITPMNEAMRRKLVYKFTTRFNIYSLGRFGIWKNVLLDDIVPDVNRIKKIIATDHYNLLKEF